jgi:hypothetical protein
VLDVPLWWIEHEAVAAEADHAAAKEQQRANATQAAINRIHGGR